MSAAASQAAKFYLEVAKSGKLWTIRDKGGFPAPLTRSGQRSQPFWSSERRALKIIKTAPDYAGFTPVEITWAEFRSDWVEKLTAANCLVGVNWSGINVVGYDLEPASVLRNVESAQPAA